MSNNKLILVVDDDEISLEMIASVLLSEGYHIATATSAKEAMDFVEQNRSLISAILMDLVMPEYSGVVAIKSIKEQRMSRLIPIMALTSSSDRESVISAIEAGADDYLTKPFNPADLLSRVYVLCKISDFVKRWDAFAR